MAVSVLKLDSVGLAAVRRAASVESEGDSTAHLKRLLAADIHDTVTPALTAILVDMENLKRRAQSAADVRAHLTTYQGELRELLSGVRDLLTNLDGDTAKLHGGLPTLLRDQLGDYSERTGINTRLTVSPDWPADLKFSTSIQIFRIVDGALRNVELHSGAEHVVITLRATGDELCILVHDDGCGIGTGTCTPGHGILGMRERAVVMGGALSVQRRRAGGTTVKLTVPLKGRRDG